MKEIDLIKGLSLQGVLIRSSPQFEQKTKIERICFQGLFRFIKTKISLYICIFFQVLTNMARQFTDH